jgi:hypothetical protein
MTGAIRFWAGSPATPAGHANGPLITLELGFSFFPAGLSRENDWVMRRFVGMQPMPKPHFGAKKEDKPGSGPTE